MDNDISIYSNRYTVCYYIYCKKKMKELAHVLYNWAIKNLSSRKNMNEDIFININKHFFQNVALKCIFDKVNIICFIYIYITVYTVYV